MWLINCSNYRLEPNDLESPQSKPYWILSHTWGDDEVTFQDMQRLLPPFRKKGFRKIWFMCKLALAGGTKYVWIDTCCIDKTSSAELSESINSMFYWYKKSERCLAFLDDLEPGAGSATEVELRRCRWFTRGWTLQELLAPRRVDFYDMNGEPRGSKEQLCQALSNITNIKNDILVHPSGTIEDVLQTVSVATKMSWAAGRQTTRIEDKAYCLLGIFDVHMPLLYGERGQAFTRLQLAIAQKSNDMSLFAWVAQSAPANDAALPASPAFSGLLASDPSQFALSPMEIIPMREPLLPPPSWIMTNAGIEMTTALEHPFDSNYTVFSRRSDGTLELTSCRSVPKLCCRLFLHCYTKSRFWPQNSETVESLAIWLRKTSSGYVRYRPTELCAIDRTVMEFNDPSFIRISTSLTKQQRQDILQSLSDLQDDNALPNALNIWWDFRTRSAEVKISYHPPHLWDGSLLCFRSTANTPLLGNIVLGLAEIVISNLAGSTPFSQTCWAFCGLASVSAGPGDKFPCNPTPWVDLACEEPGGWVEMFQKQVIWQTKDLRNPFALSSELRKLQAQGVRPDPKSFKTDCIVKCTPTLHLRIWVSDFTVAATQELPNAHHVMISGEAFDPTVDVGQ